MEKELLYKYFSGETTPAEEQKIMDWAEASPENYRFYLRERKWWDAVLVNVPSPEENTEYKKNTRKVNRWKLTAVAASVALLFALSYPIFKSGVQEDKWQSVWVPPGQRAQVVLDDGTTVWLNSQSTFRFPSSFNSDTRKVWLKGEGFFDVEKDEEKPFIVQTSRYDITVTGTSFNVFAYENGSTFETSLLDGSVRISSENNHHSAINLIKNEKVTEIEGRLVKRQIDNFDHFRWRDGLICIDDEPFEVMMEKFSLYFDILIKIENPALLEYHPTGKFRHSDGINHALKVLQRDLNFTYNRDYEKNEIVIK